jgi:hypothetical protein
MLLGQGPPAVTLTSTSATMAPPTVIAHSAVGRRCRARTIQATRPAIARHRPGHHVHAAIPMVLAASASLRRTSTPCAVSALKPSMTHRTTNAQAARTKNTAPSVVSMVLLGGRRRVVFDERCTIRVSHN